MPLPSSWALLKKYDPKQDRWCDDGRELHSLYSAAKYLRCCKIFATLQNICYAAKYLLRCKKSATLQNICNLQIFYVGYSTVETESAKNLLRCKKSATLQKICNAAKDLQ